MKSLFQIPQIATCGTMITLPFCVFKTFNWALGPNLGHFSACKKCSLLHTTYYARTAYHRYVKIAEIPCQSTMIKKSQYVNIAKQAEWRSQKSQHLITLSENEKMTAMMKMTNLEVNGQEEDLVASRLQEEWVIHIEIHQVLQKGSHPTTREA